MKIVEIARLVRLLGWSAAQLMTWLAVFWNVSRGDFQTAVLCVIAAHLGRIAWIQEEKQ